MSFVPRLGALITTPAVQMAPRDDGLEVVWAVSRLSRGWVEWNGADGSTGRAHENAFGFVPQGNRIVRVRVRGLKPGTTYRIRAVCEAANDPPTREESPWREFRTLNALAHSTKFVVWNDTHRNEETIRRLHAATPAGDFLLWNGDLGEDWHEKEWLTPTVLHAAGEDVSAGRPMFVVWGNHDVRGKWAFKMPGVVATPNNRPYYAFRSGPVAFICLHTGEDKPDDHPSFGGRVAFKPLRAQQAEWMKEIIQHPGFKNAPYRVVFCHLPLRWKQEVTVDYEAGGYDFFSRVSRNAWHDALVQWKTQVIVSGHTHKPAWLPATEEFPYAQLVGGGPEPQTATFIEGSADRSALKFTIKNLDGKILENVSFPPLA